MSLECLRGVRREREERECKVRICLQQFFLMLLSTFEDPIQLFLRSPCNHFFFSALLIHGIGFRDSALVFPALAFTSTFSAFGIQLSQPVYILPHFPLWILLPEPCLIIEFSPTFGLKWYTTHFPHYVAILSLFSTCKRKEENWIQSEPFSLSLGKGPRFQSVFRVSPSCKDGVYIVLCVPRVRLFSRFISCKVWRNHC